MCFHLGRKARKPKIAKRNIPCYKKVFIISNTIFDSYFLGFRYESGRTYTVAGFGYSGMDSDYPEITTGFHSYSASRLFYDPYSIIKCYIPKGTEYYYDRTRKEYVSLSIRIVGRVINLGVEEIKKLEYLYPE